MMSRHALSKLIFGRDAHPSIARSAKKMAQTIAEKIEFCCESVTKPVYRHLPRCSRAERRIYAILAGSGKPATKRKLNPEWHYVPAANRFLVAMAIGAITGGGVVLSLMSRLAKRRSRRTHWRHPPKL